MNFIKKPWGSELIIESNDKYTFKKLTMHQGCQCSLQYHDFKHETIYIIQGKLNIYSGHTKNKLSVQTFLKDEFISLPPKLIHRMEALEDCIYLEASSPEINDVVRLMDDYKRIPDK